MAEPKAGPGLPPGAAGQAQTAGQAGQAASSPAGPGQKISPAGPDPEGGKSSLSPKSSLLVRTACLVLWGVGALVGKLVNSPQAAGFFSFLLLLGLASRLWAALSIRRVEFELYAPVRRAFPGQELSVELRLSNRKFLPLVWGELVQFFGKDAPLLPCEGVRALSREESALEGFEGAELLGWRQRFSLLLWESQLRCPCTWQARRRGLYRPQRVLLRTGDGLGLTQLARSVEVPGQPFAVYPALQPVRTGLFLRYVWTSQRGGRGFLEDPTLLRTTRPYQPGDSWRRINWRMAALGLPLEANIQETVLPRNAHFVLDGQSWQGPDADREGLEDALSLIASLAVELEARGVQCGLSLSAGAGGGPVCLPAFGGPGREELLYCLAAWQPRPDELDGEGKIKPPSPSRFEEAALASAQSRGERLYLFCRRLPAQPGAFWRRLAEGGATLVLAQPPEGGCPWPFVSFDSLKGGGS